jgi:hypothetical protein
MARIHAPFCCAEHGIPLPVDNGTAFRSRRHGTLLPQARHSAPGGTALCSRRHGIALPVPRHSAPGDGSQKSQNVNVDKELRRVPENTNLLLISLESMLCRSLHNSPPKGGNTERFAPTPHSGSLRESCALRLPGLRPRHKVSPKTVRQERGKSAAKPPSGPPERARLRFLALTGGLPYDFISTSLPCLSEPA